MVDVARTGMNGAGLDALNTEKKLTTFDSMDAFYAQASKLEGQNVTVEGVKGIVENGQFVPADEANADASIWGNNEAEELGDTFQASAAGAAQAADGQARVATTPEGQEILDEISELEDKRDANYEEMDAIKAEIETLTAEAEDEINQALMQQEAAVAEHEEETKKLVNENLNAYIEANKNGEGMTREQLQQNIKDGAASAGLPAAIGDATALIMSANGKLDEVDGLLGDLNSLINDTKTIETEIDAKIQEFDAVEAAAEAERQAEAQSNCNPCDPIGFQATDKNGNKAQYDFIKDDGAFDSTDDFLGAENQWAEMQALDTDGDNIVTAAELEAGNIKAVKTNEDGSQEVVSMADEFGEDFQIDLSTYQQGGSHSAIDSTSDTDGDGILDQELLGTFSVNTGSETVQGYNTLDDVDFLTENYGIQAGTQATAGTEEAEATEFEFSTELQENMNFFQTYTEKVAELREKLMEAWKSIGATEEQVTNYNEISREAMEDVETVKPGEESNNEEATEENLEGTPEAETTVDTETADVELGSNPFGTEVNPEELELEWEVA